MTEYPDVTRSGEPMDRLTELCAKITKPLDEPEYEDVRAIVFIQDGHKGGIQIYGYEDETQAMADLFVHMKAIFNAMGKDLQFVGIPESPEGIDGL